MSTPGEDAAKGVTKAILEFTVERIPELVRRFQNKEIAFIKDRENINTVKQERDSAEWRLISPFVPKEERLIGIQIQMGLALRALEGQPERLEDLRQKILTRFGNSALHIAELAQRGIVAELLARLAKMYASPGDVQTRFISFMKLSEDFAIFVKETDNVTTMARVLRTRIEGIGPHTIILLGRGFARSTTNKIIERLRADKRKYVIERQEQGNQLLYFVYTPEIKASTNHWAEAMTSE